MLSIKGNYYGRVVQSGAACYRTGHYGLPSWSEGNVCPPTTPGAASSATYIHPHSKATIAVEFVCPAVAGVVSVANGFERPRGKYQ